MATVQDEYSDQAKSMLTLGNAHEVITPHDTNPLTRSYKYIVIGITAGPVTCIDHLGVTAVHHVPAGGKLQVRPHIIMATGTTAATIIGVFDG